MDAEDREDDYKAQIARLQAEVSAAVSRLQSQGDSREAVGAAGWERGQGVCGEGLGVGYEVF